MFGAKHLILLALSAAIIAGGSILTRKWDFAKLCKALFLTGIVSETVKILYYIVTNEADYGGILPRTDLPFHLCSIQILFVAAVVYCKNEKVRRVLLSFMMPSCLLGGVAALLLPTATALQGLPILSAQYFGYHCALIVFGLRLIRDPSLNIKSYVNCIKVLCALFFFAVYINSMLYDDVSNINFMYVASPPMSGLPYLTEEHGWLVYIAHYGILAVFCVSLCYCRQIFSSLFSRKKQPVA